MIEKEVATSILEDIENSLYKKDWKEQTLKTISIYRKGLEISSNKKIKKLIQKHIEYRKLYGENGRKTIKINKKIDKIIRKINK